MVELMSVRAKKACEFAQVDPGRFNEMVHSGHYPCAPETRPGSVRTFDLDQIVTLKIFGDLLSLPMPPSRAGRIACSAYKIFGGRKEIERLICKRDAVGEWVVEVETPLFSPSMASPTQMVIDVSEHRERAGDLIDWEQSFGKGDD